MAKSNLDSLLLEGDSEVVGTPTVSILLRDVSNDVLMSSGVTVPTDADSGYSAGSFFVKTDGGVGSTWYVNEGSNTSSDFNAITASGGTSYDNIGDAGANGTIAFAGYTNDWTTSLDTGSFFTLTNSDASLAGATNLVDLVFTDDGSANGIFLRAIDNASDVKFTIGADGATIIAGSATGTAALTLTAGDITMTAGDIDIAADNRRISFGAAGDTDSYIYFDGAGNLTFYDSTVGIATTLSQLTGSGLTNPTVTGDLTISDGKFDWTDAADEVAGTWTFNGTTGNDIFITSAVTSGDVVHATADSMTTGSIFVAESSTAGMTTGNYFEALNGGTTVFEVGSNGITTIAGTAATDVLIVTAGDLQMTAGDINLDLGTITIDNTADEANKISRNNATGTDAVFEIEETHATGGINLLLDTKNTTAAEYNLDMTSAGATQIHLGANGAAGDGILMDATDSHTGQFFKIDAGPWLGTAGEGAALDFRSDSGAVAEAGHAIYINMGGTSADAAAIDGKGLYIEDEAASTAGSYLINLDSANNGAFHVSAGGSQFDGTITVGVSDTGHDVKIFGATADKFMVWDESADDLILADGVALQLGGDESTADGFKIEFDGTADLNFDALTANDNINFGPTTDTDVIFHGTTGGADVSWTAATDTLSAAAAAQIVAIGNGTGTGLVIPFHATNTPSDTVQGSLFFEVDAKKLWVYDGTGWVGTVLA